MTANELGILYGIGVGPGDPDLMTLKALRVLRSVQRIFAAGSSKNDYSIAMGIAQHHLGDVRMDFLPFPMTKDKALLNEAWNQNARLVMETLKSGEDAGFVTIGDPSTYSTYGYLLKALKDLCPEVRAVTIPGVPSYCAAAAAANIPLCEAEESCHLISGAYGSDKLRRVVGTSENVVMLKTYKHFDEIYDTLDELDLLGKATCVSMCGYEDERVCLGLDDLKGRKMPYLSLIIIKNRRNRHGREGE
ncbi:MAG: precorrin-2 C(20)-methyltransferase [Candidatus Odinarchaeota archaeon]